MSDKWSKYKKILDREGEEFKRAMEVEVSTSFLSEFSNRIFSNRIFTGVDIITQYPIDFAIFK